MYTDRWLYLDDVRTPVSDKFDVVRNFDEFKLYILKNGIPKYISFDHDLAPEHMNDFFKQVGEQGFQNPDYDSYKEMTGLDCARWLALVCQENNLELRNLGVHSHNPVGTTNILSFLNGFKKHMGWTPDVHTNRPEFTVGKEHS